MVCTSNGNSGKTQTICVAPEAVPAFLRKGATLGDCGLIPCESNSESISKEASFRNAKVQKAYPNPLEDEVNITLDSNLDIEVAYILFDEKGELVQSGTSSFNSGKLQLIIGSKQLKKGFYYLHLNHGQETKMIRLMKK